MLKNVRGAAALALATLIALAAACGSGDGDSGNATATPRVQVYPTVVGNVVVFTEKGYRMEIPDGWTFEPNLVSTPSGSPDSVIAPNSVDGVQANVVITCEPTGPGGTTVDEYFDIKAERAQRLGATQLAELDPMTVDGEEARVLGYQRTLDEANQQGTPTGRQVTIARRDVLFIHEGCAWQIAYTAAPGTVEEFAPQFQAFVTSFKFVPQE
jgi:hypothetical protein